MKNKMVKSALAFAVMSAVLVLPSVAFADDTPVIVTKTVKVVGHRQMPSVVIEIARLSAAHEAGIAHESVRRSLLEQSVPATLKQR